MASESAGNTSSSGAADVIHTAFVAALRSKRQLVLDLFVASTQLFPIYAESQNNEAGLLDHIPVLYDEMTLALERAPSTLDTHELSDLLKAAHIHATMRLHKGFMSVDIAREFQLLRRAIWRAIGPTLSAHLTQPVTQPGASPFMSEHVIAAEEWSHDMIDAMMVIGLTLFEQERKSREDQLTMEIKTQAGLAQRRMREREEMLTIVSHELRTPVTALRGYTQLALRRLRQPPDPAIEQPLRQIDGAVVRLQRMVEDLLNVSHLTLGSYDVAMNREPVNLTSIVQACCSAVVIGQERRAVSFTGVLPAADVLTGDTSIRGPATPVWVHGDADRLSQVVMNLLTNALKYSAETEPVIARVLVDPIPKEVWIQVVDRGPGVDPGDREKIFGLFQRGRQDNSTSGLGIGLFVSKAIVQAHGGRIWIEPLPTAKDAVPSARGSVFCVALPRIDAPVSYGSQ